MKAEEEEAEEEEGEWEEEYVFVELIGMVDPDKLSLCSKDNTAILGLGDEEITVLKLGGYIFGGKYEEVIGTKVFFEEKEDNQLKYFCHTTKMLKTSRAFLKQKSKIPNDENDTEEEFTGQVESPPDNSKT